MEQIKKLLTSFSARQKILMAALTLAIAAGAIGLTRWQADGDFRPLFSALAAEDAAAVVSKLKERSVPYRVSDTGGSVLVPSARVAELRLEMAASGLPKSGRIGFELFDKTNFGASDFSEQINYHRALEGELERSVMAVAEIESARVHLTFPKSSVYLDERQPAKASVLVRLRAGNHLAPESTLAIAHLLSSAVEGLSPQAVSILDMHGRLLMRAKKLASADGPEPSEGNLEYQRMVERNIASKVQATLEPLLGAERFRVGVLAECDFTSGEEAEETFDPDKALMTSQTKSEEHAPALVAEGVPGTSSTLPRPTSTPANSGGAGSRTSESATFQTSRKTRRVRLPQGTVQRLSVSVLIDHDVRWEGSGSKAHRVVTAPTPERMKTIKDLVTGLVGLNTERGDQLIVESLPFDLTTHEDPPAAKPATPVKKEAPITWNDPRLLIPAGIGIAVLAGAGFLMLRMMKRTSKADRKTKLVDGQIAKPEELVAGAPAEKPGDSVATQLEAKATVLTLPPAGPQKVVALASLLRESVQKDSELCANVLRDWVEAK